MHKFPQCYQAHKHSNHDGEPEAQGPAHFRRNQIEQPTRLFAGTRRNRIVVAGIFGHSFANIRMGREELAEFRMVPRIAVAVDQRGLVSQLTRDVGMLACEAVPGLKLLQIDIARIGGFELDRGVSVDDGAQRPSFLRD